MVGVEGGCGSGLRVEGSRFKLLGLGFPCDTFVFSVSSGGFEVSGFERCLQRRGACMVYGM